MPYKFESDKLLIPRELKKSVKLFLEDKENILKDYEIIKSQRKLAVKYKVSRRLIQFILNPESLEKNKLRLKENQKKYYNAEKHKNYKKDFRDNKYKLFKLKKLY